MAVMKINSRMVYWDVFLKSSTTGWMSVKKMMPGFGKYVNSISVKDTIAFKKSKGAPSELDMSITSNNYCENLFTEGIKIRAFLGYDILGQPLVFDGEIRHLPDGGAKEMLNYTVKAYSNDITFSNIELNRTFSGRTKSAIIMEISSKNKFEAVILIKNDILPKAGFSRIQKGITDMELMNKLAKEWGCVWWLDRRGILFFVDAEDAHEVGTLYNTRLKGQNYTFGYRTDRVLCNVESIDWSATPRPGGSEIESMMESFNEFGKNPAANKYKINALGGTWKLQEPYLSEATKDPLAFGSYALYAAGQSVSGNGYDVLRKFFIWEHGDVSDSNREVPDAGGASTGIELNIRLNEGDPYLKPPLKGLLYAGVLNPLVNSAALPGWLFNYGIQNKSVAKLDINETVLTYSQGRLESQVKCSLRA